MNKTSWRRIAVLASTAVGLLLGAAVPAQAGSIPDSWYHHTARFWENPSFENDGVELGAGAYDLRNVTRDCFIGCWNNWNDVPQSLHIAADTWLTVWEHDQRGACVSFWGGAPFAPGGRTPGRAWPNLGNIAAGWASGNWNRRITYAAVTPVSSYWERPFSHCPEAVW